LKNVDGMATGTIGFMVNPTLDASGKGYPPDEVRQFAASLLLMCDAVEGK
jgi:hypothetical protein